MSGRWIGAERAAFVRDLMRDFCHVCAILAEQRQRFADTGTISHAVLRDLLGKDMRKGVFWRLKDTSHQLFRMPADPRSGPSPGSAPGQLSGSSPDPSHGPTKEATEGAGRMDLWQYASGKTPGGMVCQGATEGLLDWCLGYAFHECVKLKEDAFQRQHYANRLVQMRGRVGDCEGILAELEPLAGQTRESIGRELTRILVVLGHARGLLLRYLRAESNNGPLARWLLSEEALVRDVFADRCGDLMEAIYGGSAARLFLLATRACLEGGRPQQALQILDRLERETASDALSEADAAEAQRLHGLAVDFDVTRPVRSAAG